MGAVFVDRLSELKEGMAGIRRRLELEESERRAQNQKTQLRYCNWKWAVPIEDSLFFLHAVICRKI